MAKKQAYVVLVGVKPGVYTNWLDVAENTTGVPHAQFQGFTYFDDAARHYERAHRRGATRAVKRPPKEEDEDEDKPVGMSRKSSKKPEGRSDGGPVRQRRRQTEDSSPADSVAQTPTSTPKGSSAGRAARDAQIAAALAGARTSKIGPSASSPSVISTSERRQQQDRLSRRTAALARSATEPAYHIQVQPRLQDSPTVSESARTPARTRPRSTRRTVELPSPEPDARRRPRMSRTPETRTGSEPRGPVSDIPTNEARTANRFANSPGLSTPRYRYAQSLSYASSPSLASSDMRTHISSPSSFGTRYFPEDWLARIGPSGQRREAGVADRDDRNSVLSTSLSEYATAPNTPEQGSTELEDEVEDVRGANANLRARERVGWSESSRSNPRSAVTRSKTWSSTPSPPPATATATEVISSPSATSTPRRTGSTPNSASINGSDCFSPSLASVPPSSPPSEPKNKKTTTRVTQSLSEAEVQTEPSLTQARRRKNTEAEAGVQTDSPRRRQNPEAGVQATSPSPLKRQHFDNGVQTSPVASPLPASTAVGNMPMRPLPGGFPCACEHPEYACVNCGERPRIAGIEEGSGRCAGSPARSSRTPSTIAATASPVPSELLSAPSSSTPSASAVSSSVSSRSSSRSRGGHTPIMGPSESRAYIRSPTARIQESLGMMSFSEAARGVGAEAVVHDVSFDPRSPIQRGTNIPAGTSGSVVRPSPAMVPVPVPMGSLGLMFPS